MNAEWKRDNDGISSTCAFPAVTHSNACGDKTSIKAIRIFIKNVDYYLEKEGYLHLLYFAFDHLNINYVMFSFNLNVVPCFLSSYSPAFSG